MSGGAPTEASFEENRFWSPSDRALDLRDPRRRNLHAARDAFDRALAGKPEGPILPAVVDVIRRFKIPPAHFHAVMNGAAMDLAGRTYDTTAETDDYCHHVAVVVGFICLHVWGYRDEAAFAPAMACGLAFQWTNILRDLGEDAAAGRIYLPASALATAGYSAEELREGVDNEAFRRLLATEVARVEGLFDEAAPLAKYLDRDGVPIFAAMYATYRELLREIARGGDAVLYRRVRVPRWRKFVILARAWWSGGAVPAAHLPRSGQRAMTADSSDTPAVGL
ncbi:MAG: phytoene/squalene synthase family protein [Pirellulales bacterium]